jgi:tetratricopeptide (TPR) repeat protein/serine/threonine protein kinase
MSDSTPARPTADLNLLFGILALQMDFVSRDALIAAMNAWVLDKAKPLGQIMLEQGALRPDTHALLEALVGKHLEMHDNDPQKSLAAVSSLGSVREQIRQVGDAELHASLAHVSAARNEGADPFVTRPPTVGTSSSAGLRFRILRPHAQGGLGEVFVAHDGELRREVALKEIQDRYADDPYKRERFLLEAEITGGLEHPGVVPVYGLGTYADGRPFYAMRFIRGNSLHDAIERFHKAEVAGRDPGERSLALRQLLGRFVDVCDAIAYAHSRGVLHRDLKPDNIMLGRYGETLVVDWGLAKPVGRPAGKESAEEGPLQPASASSSSPTQMGSVLGTPQYMPPEQAAGRLDQLGAASDVYSLGATLYCLLTGKAPFEGQEAGGVLQRVQRGDFPPPRQVKRDIPTPLEAVCLKAMALRTQDRYPTPLDLKGDIEHWLADEPVSAWREPWRLRAGRWARRHQTAAAATAAGLLVALLAGGAGGWWQQRQQAERRAEAARQEGALRQDVEARLGQTVRFRQGGHFDEARDLLEQAQRRLGADGPADLRGQVKQAMADTALAESLDAARLQASTMVEGKFDVAGSERAYAAAIAATGLGQEGEDPGVVAARVRASAVRAEVVAALDDWASITGPGPRREWLLAVARAADRDPERDRLRQPGLWRDKAVLARRAGEARVAELSPQLATALGRALRGSGGGAVLLLREAQGRRPHDFWLNFELGNALHEVKEWDEAIGHYRAALALRPRTVVVHNNLGVALREKGRLDEAISHCEQALTLDPKDAPAHCNLGHALRDKGRLDEAISHYEQALTLDPKLALAHGGLGQALQDKGRLDEAISHYQQALTLDPKLAPWIALAHYNLGHALYNQGKVAEAVGHYEEALRLDPKLALAHNNLGVALKDKGQLDEAISHYEQALRLDPNYAHAHNNLGTALCNKGKVEEAISHYEQALRLDPKLALAHRNLGDALYQQGKLAEAVGHYEQALRLAPKDAPAHNGLGLALYDKGRLDEAVSHYEQAIRLDPKHAGAHNNLGLALQDKGRLGEAVGHYEQALRLDPRLAQAHVNLGIALRQQGKLAEAVGHYEQALRLDPRLAQAHAALGRARLAQGRWAEARDSTRRCLDLLPQGHPLRSVATRQLQRCERMLALEARLPAVLAEKDRPTGAEWLEFAGLCQVTKRYAAAARLYADAFAAGPKFADDLRAGYRYNTACCAALAAGGQGTDAAKLDDKERTRLRRQVLDCLRADLALWGKQLEGATPPVRAIVQKTLLHWQQDPDLAGVRDASALAKLPEAERVEWQKLWADVAALLKKAEADGKS